MYSGLLLYSGGTEISVGLTEIGQWVNSTLTETGERVFDPITATGQLVFGLEVALTVTLFATGDGTITGVVDEADGTTNIWQSVDDDPASPTDSDWVNNQPTTATVFFDVTDMPAAFDTADAATIVVRYRGLSFGGPSKTLHAQLFQSNESTSLSDEITVANVAADSSFDNTAALTFTGLNTSANKSVWDAARIRFRWS